MAGRFTEAKNVKVDNTPKENTENHIQVAFYGRVSKNEENMLRSLKNQPEILGNWMERYPDWEIFHIYLDEGITGLNTKKRHEFNQMMQDAKAHKFQVILIKSVTRFGRNISDTSKALDVLLALGIRIVFLEDNIDSANQGDIQKFGLFAWLAEIESRKISERVNLTFDKMKGDGYYFGSKSPYGYTKVEGKLFINADESQTIQNIYNWYLQGIGATVISNKLAENNIKPPLAKRWSEQHIKRILSNPCYIGDTYTNQSKTIDFKNRIRITNAIDEWNYFPNTHDPIIDKEIFNKVQQLMSQKKKLYKENHRPSSKHLLSNLIICGRCNSSYTRKAKKDRKILWNCWKYDKYGTAECTSESVNEEDLFLLLEYTFSNLKQNKDKLKQQRIKEKESLAKNQNNVIVVTKQLEDKKERLQVKLDKLLDLYTDDMISKDDYLQRSNPVSQEIKGIDNEIIAVIQGEENDKMLDMITNNLIKDLDMLGDRENWTNAILKRHIEYIKVYDKENIEILLFATKKSFNLSEEKEYLNTNTHCSRCVEGGTSKEIARFQCIEVSKPINVIGYVRIRD